VDLTLIACILGGVTLAALAAIVSLRPGTLTVVQTLGAFAGACSLTVLASWRRAVLDGRLPATPNGQPRHEHITGWGFLALTGVIIGIVGLAAWASTDETADKQIHSDWGIVVVFGLAVAFISAAIAPLIINNISPDSIIRKVGGVASPLLWIAHPFGAALSFLDSVLVFAVAGGAGAAQPSLLLRYALLFASVFPCAVLGYWLPAPWGLAPISWGFLVAISISRRWSWVEDDREIYMLNRRFGAHLRIGFGQDLRDEALLSFMSLFFLVPLALRQAHGWSVQLGEPLFSIDAAAQIGLLDWIGYYGTELAKAVPFVDWAEIYQVEGDAPISAESSEARHAVFATRVLVDLVFLAALLQALSISARNAKQMELFKAGVLDRLDPFVEPREFRKLVRRSNTSEWEVSPEALAKFPKYDAIRLAELSAPEHHPISLAAKALRRRDSSDDSARFHEQLIERAFQKRKDADSIDEVLTALRMTDAQIDADDLDRVRVELNNRRAMNGIREALMRLILRSTDPAARFAAIRSALIGQSSNADGPPDTIRDSVAPVRRIALEGLRSAITMGDTEAQTLVEKVIQSDPAPNIKRLASDMLSTAAPRA
jgi:hypothetical protein